MKALSEIYRLVKKGALNFCSFGCFSKISANRHFRRLSKMIAMVFNTSALTSWPRIYPQNRVWTIGSWVIPLFVFSGFKNQTCPGWGMARDPNVLHFDWTIYLRLSGSPHSKNNRFWSINAWAIHNWNFQLLRALQFLSYFHLYFAWCSWCWCPIAGLSIWNERSSRVLSFEHTRWSKNIRARAQGQNIRKWQFSDVFRITFQHVHYILPSA
jgi:hypothetical protein